MRKAIRESSLSLCFLLLFVACVVGQSYAGWKQFNNHQLGDSLPPVPWGDYVTSASFAVDVAENWQSEYLQFFCYILATVWLIQKGSPESKEPGQQGRGTDEEQKVGRYAESRSPGWAKVAGWRRTVYSSSLVLTMFAIFVLSWTVQSVAGWVAYDESLLQSLRDPISWPAYLSNADLWSRTLQNWQSEFLAVGSMAVLSIYLRQRGSPESKPVGAPHDATDVEG